MELNQLRGETKIEIYAGDEIDPELLKKGSVRKIMVNGQTYDKVEDVPQELREIASKVWSDSQKGNGKFQTEWVSGEGQSNLLKMDATKLLNFGLLGGIFGQTYSIVQSIGLVESLAMYNFKLRVGDGPFNLVWSIILGVVASHLGYLLAEKAMPKRKDLVDSKAPVEIQKILNVYIGGQEKIAMGVLAGGLALVINLLLYGVVFVASRNLGTTL